nr:retrovirus-related Pol polyprotein from transposon TNT 1-94 [Tanacetum cinerariifolium]
MTDNRALLTNFVEKFLGTVRFGNNDFAVIAGYGDVVIGSMTIKKVYYVEGLGHNLFSVGQLCDKGLEVAFRKSTCFVRNEDGVDFLTGDRSSNLYTIALNEVASNSLTCLLAKASSSQSWLWHQHLSHLNFATINNLVKNHLVQCLPKMKFKKDHLCSACEQGKIHRKHHKSKTAFASNKPLYLLNMDLCGPMRVQSINEERYMLVVIDDYSRRNRTLLEAVRTMLTFANLPSFLWAEAIATACFIQNRSIIHKRFDKTPYELINQRKPNIKFFRVFGCRCYLLNDYEDVAKLKAKGDIGVFVGYSKESASFRIYNKRTHKIHESVNVNFDKLSDMASKQFSLEPSLSNLNETGKYLNLSVLQVDEASKKDLEDLSQDFYDEYFDSSKIMKSSTTNVETSINEEVFHELISINMIPNGNEASTSHNVFNERLEDAYFDASTSFHDPSNVHTYYQPYPHEKKWTKDHPLHKIIGDPKSSVRTRGQLANSCLFSCLLSFIEPANVAEALKDVDWVIAMQEELDQFARLKVWRLVPRPKGKFVIKTKWIFRNKKDEGSLVIQNKARLVAVGYSQQEDHVYALDKALYGLKEAPQAWYDVLLQFLIESGFQKVQRVRTDNGTEFKNKTLGKFFDEVGITQQFPAARTPQQNGVVERRNRSLVEAARTMLTFANLPSFLWAEAIATACFTQNRLIIHKRFYKTPYELMNKRKPNIKFFRVLGCRCYLLNDYEDVGKLKEKGDIGVFVGYSKESAAFRIYNKRTRKIHESVNVNFDEISKMASKQFSLEPGLSKLNETGKSSNRSVSKVDEASKNDLEDLFQYFYDEYFDSSKIMKSSTTNVETS